MTLKYNGIPALSIIRETKPYGLFRYFKKHNIRLCRPCHGIYHVLDNVLFPTQIIVSDELDKSGYTWLTLYWKSVSEPIRRLSKN